MGRLCIVCAHPKVKEINKLLADENAQYSAISRTYFGSTAQRDALRRHVDGGHIPAKIQKAAAAQVALEANDFLTHLEGKRKRFKEMADKAKKENDPHLELKVYQIEGKFMEIEGKALGVFKADKPGIPSPTAVSKLTDEEVERRAREILAKRKHK